MRWLEEQKIDAYVADNRFRKRDPSFQEAERHKPEKPESKRFTQADVSHDKERLTCRYPAGESLYLKNRNFRIDGHIAVTLGLNRFTLRGKDKVNGQWQLFGIVHNLGKLHQYTPGIACRGKKSQNRQGEARSRVLTGPGTPEKTGHEGI